MSSFTRISTPQLKRLIGTPACPILVDVCIDEDFAEDPRLIPGAIRHPFTQMEQLILRYTGQKIVVICQKGKKLSQGAAAVLRAGGIEAEYLESGNYGWRDAGGPLIPVSSIPARDTQGSTVWVTRHRPKIDRIACPWLIRRFVDRDAKFLFVSPSEVMDVAEKFNAVPFDVEGVFWSHRGANCTFDTMIEEFNLDIEPLLTLAEIVRGADTNRHNLAPEAAGLFALSLGLSRMYKDDGQQMEAGMLLYDAMYRWARDAGDEVHDSAARLEVMKADG